MNNSFRAVLFDFDGTLVFDEPDSFNVVRDYCAEIGQPLSAETERLGRRMRHYYFADPSIFRQSRHISRDEFWQRLIQHLLEAMCIQGDLAQLASGVSERFLEREFVHHFPEAGRRTLTELRARGYQLGLITNRDNVDRFYELLGELALGPYFDLVLASGEVGVRKPEPGIFHAALERMGTEASAALYVGDNYWADVVGAQSAGVTPVLLGPLGLFPEAECRRLDRIDQLLEWLL
jgi:putative hydrolase of the HAD superfamily